MAVGKAGLSVLMLTPLVFGLAAPGWGQEEVTESPMPPAVEASPGPAGKLDTFDQRKKAMLEAVWEEYQKSGGKPGWKNVFLMAGALFEMGKSEEGRKLANFGLDGLQP